MARYSLDMGLALILITSMLACSLAQPSCPPAIVSLQPCLGFITTNSSSSTPSPQCCTQLASMVQSQVKCLCTILYSVPLFPFNINQTRSIRLPGACNIQTPPLSQCNAPSGPSVPATGSPQGSPAPTSQVTPSAATAPSPFSPSAPSGTSPPSPSPSTTSSTGVPSRKGVPKINPTKGITSSSCRISTMFTPSLLFLLSVALVFSNF